MELAADQMYLYEIKYDQYNTNLTFCVVRF